ncbi:EamA family transporter [Weissella confusa]|uniref:EamA family transporter n=1 Tax=Weissella confusa TaxID=1583 RepID=UPI002477E9CB|nr:EamA family transporter [Weissella confusa]
MSKQWYVGMAAGGALFWGINGILSNMLFDRIAISPDWLTTARLLISGVALLLYSLIRRQNIFCDLASTEERRLVSIVWVGWGVFCPV